MFKPRSINVLVILLLLAGIGLSLQKLLSTKTLEENPSAKNTEPVLPIEWSEPTWPTPDKLGKSPTIMSLLPIPDWTAKDMQNKKIIPHLTARFPDTQLLGLNLEQTIAEIAKATGLTIVVEWDELAKQGIKRDSPLTGSSYQSATLDGVLNEVFKRVYGVEGKLGYDICEGIIRVNTKEALDRRSLFTRVYNIADIMVAMDKVEEDINKRLNISPPTSMASNPLAAKMDQMVKIIQDNVLKDSWDSAGGPASVRPVQFLLVITQTPEGHAHIERLLEQFRQIVRGK